MSRRRVLSLALLGDVLIAAAFWFGQAPVQARWGEAGAVWLAAGLAVGFILLNIVLIVALRPRNRAPDA